MTESIAIFDNINGVEQVRELTENELAELLAERERFAEDKKKRIEEIETKALAKKAVLEKLGLTEEEAAVLLG